MCRLHSLRIYNVLCRRDGIVSNADAADQDTIIVCGGWNIPLGLTNTCEQYDVTQDLWLPFPSMKTKKADLALVRWEDGALYAFGGYHSGLNLSDTVEKFDWSTNEWRVLDDVTLPYAMAEFAAVVVPLS